MSHAASDSFNTELRPAVETAFASSPVSPAAVFGTPYAGRIHVDTNARDGDAGVDGDARPSPSGRLFY